MITSLSMTFGGQVYTFNFLSFVLEKEDINDFSKMNDF